MDIGERYCKIIEKFHIPAGKLAGQCFHLLPAHREFVTQLFGTLDADGLRTFRKGLCFIPKKNAKSTLASAIIVASLFLNKQKGMQIYSAGLSLEQSSIVFRAAQAIIEADPLLSERFTITKSKKLITDTKTNSTYQALSRENKARNGLLPSILVCDEIAEWDDSAMLDLYEKLESGMVGAKEPLIIYLTTAGISRKSIGYEIYQHAKRVQEDPTFDPRFLPVIYEAPPDADWRDIKVWERCNPGWNITIEPTTAQQMITEAENQPSKITQLLRYHLNLWVDSDNPWIPADKWDACGIEKYDLASLKGRSCWIGVDLASVQDLSAAVLVFPLDNGTWAIVPRFYLPWDTAVERSQRDGVPYLQWIREGQCLPTNGGATDYDFIRADLNKLAGEYQVRGIAIDRNLQGAQLATQLAGDGLNVIPFGLGYYSMSAPCKTFETLIIKKQLLHNAHPILAWNARNVVADVDAAGNIKPNKSTSADKIDGIVALLMGLGIAGLEAQPGESVYEHRGIVCV